MEHGYLITADSSERRFVVIQDDEPDFERGRPRRGGGARGGRGIVAEHKRRSRGDGWRNIFWVYHDKICTVPTGRGVLPGITRAVVLEICQALGLETDKRVIKPEHLRKAEGIFVTQSALGIVPVVVFDGEPVAPSPLVDQIASAYNEMLLRE